jgi:hypothetical protein
MVPYGESSTHKITGVIARLRQFSPYFVLDKCRIKRDKCAFDGSKTSYFAVQQLTGFITFQGKQYVWLKWANKKQETPKSISFDFYQDWGIVKQPI